MPKEDKIRLKPVIILFVILTGAFVSSYLYFIKYQPKVLKKIEEVKGLRQASETNLVYPEDAENVSFNQTEKAVQSVFKTQKTQAQVQTFYKNLLTELEWEVESVSTGTNSTITKYEKGKKLASVTAEQTPDYTLVRLEIYNK